MEDPVSLERLVGGAGTVFHLAGVLRAGCEEDFDRGNRAGAPLGDDRWWCILRPPAVYGPRDT